MLDIGAKLFNKDRIPENSIFSAFSTSVTFFLIS